MKAKIHLPENPLEKFKEIYRSLYSRSGVFTDKNSIRFTAVSSLTISEKPEVLSEKIMECADKIKKLSGWFGELTSPVSLIIGSILIQNGITPEELFTEIERVSKIFRLLSLRRGAVYEKMAILILMTQLEKPIEQTDVERFQEIYEEMKKYHWWLTGPEDFPACAILTAQKDNPDKIGYKIEEIYNDLRRADFSRGDPLQTASHLLYLANLPAEVIVKRYAGLAEEFKHHGVSIWQSDYDELSILSFLEHPADRIVETVLKYREEMKLLKPKPDFNATFNLASSITFFDLVQKDADMQIITDTKALLNMQQIINAQQAAVAATAGACAASSAAASSSAH